MSSHRYDGLKRGSIGLAIAALLGTGCTEGPTALRLGDLKISVATTGTDHDDDGYELIIDSKRRLRVTAIPDATLHVDDLAAGTHTLTLGGLAEYCTPEGANPRSVIVAPGDTSEVEIVVKCDGTGIEVRTHTTGPDQPHNGFVLKFGELSTQVGTNASVLLTRIPPGTYTVSLSAGDNCRVTSDNPTTVDVLGRTLAPVTFEIACVRFDRRFAFVKDSLIGNFYYGAFIVVSGPDGVGAATIARGYTPAWSPDGTRLAYSNAECDYYYGLPCTGGLVIIDPDTRTESVPAGGRLGMAPSWSPDGRLIAFSRLEPDSESNTLYVYGLDGSPPTPLRTAGRIAYHPSWSPDGERIVFQCFGVGRGTDICVINKDGTGFTALTENAGWDGTPAWSPDGSRIAFRTDRFPGEASVALMTPDGKDVVRLAGGWDPAWSPDGSKLIFAQSAGLFTTGSDGSNLTRVTTGRHYAPAWRP